MMDQMELPEITLFTQNETLSGSIFISTPEGRLLDELNGRITPVSESRDKFIKLTDVVIQHMDDRQENVEEVYINRGNVQMAATSSATLRRGIGGKPDPKPYPYTEKVPLPVRIMMTGYEITGSMYRISYQKVEHVLLEKTNFMPLTDAEVISLTSDKRWDVPFIAVNKEQILSLYELSKTGI